MLDTKFVGLVVDNVKLILTYVTAIFFIWYITCLAFPYIRIAKKMFVIVFRNT